MKPQARVKAVIDILEKLEDSRIPMDSVVGDYMRYRRYIGSKDRANIAERIYEIVRHHARLGWWLEGIKAQDTPRSRLIAYLLLVERIEAKKLSDLFDGSQYAPDAITDDEAGLLTLCGNDLTSGDMPEAVALECPPLYQASLQDYLGQGFADEMAALLQPATLDLRVNTILADRKKVQTYLQADGIETLETPFSLWGLRCAQKAYLAKTKAFHKGWIEIQDEGSQLIAQLCAAQPGMQVLDYCAGAGGKTLALAAAMEKKGRIVAMDLDEKRLNKSRERFKKAGASDVIEVRPLTESRHRKWLRRQKESFDVVLLDVPCTGTGTWRRNPDMRWRVYGPALEVLIETQKEILEKVAGTVKPGGKLVYATCSLLPEENEQQIEAFLQTHAGFEVEPVPQELGQPFMRLTPHRHNTDGFFAAVLVKQ